MTSAESAPFGSAAWIDAELRARLGEGATIGEITFEGRVATIAGARIAVGEATIEIERAEIELGAGGAIGSLPISVRLVSLRGAIAAPSIALSMPIELRASEPAAPRWFSGEMQARSASLAGVSLGGAGSRRGGAEGARLAGRVLLRDAEAASEIAITAEPAIEIDLTTRGAIDAIDAIAIDGRAFARRIAIARRSMPDAAWRLDDVSVVLDVDRKRLRYRDLSARAHGARVSGWGRVPFVTPAGGAASVPIAAISIAHAGAGPIASIASLAGLTVRASGGPIADASVIAIPADLGVSGEIVVMRDHTMSAAAIAATPRSELRFRLAPSAPFALEGSTLRGRLAVEDAIVLGMFPGPVRPSRATMLDIDARLTRTIASPGLVGRVSSSRLVLVISDDPNAPRLAFDRLSTMLDVDRDRLAWHGLSGRFSGGTFTSSGQVGLGLSSAIEATVGWTSVRIEQIPTRADGKSEIAKYFDGLLSGELRLSRHAAPGAEVSARGHVTIAEPRYRFLDALAPDLARIGLPKLRSESNQALTADVAFSRGRVTAKPIVAVLSDVEAGGEVSVGTDGTLRGALVAHVLPSYLAESPLFAVHVALAGRVAVPIDLGGTVSAPEITTRALQILESLLMENRVGDAVKSALDSLGEWSREKRKGR